MDKIAQTKLYDVKLSQNLCTMINVIAFLKVIWAEFLPSK